LRNEFEKCGVREDGNQRRSERGVVDFRGNESRMERNLGEDERELRRSGKPNTDFHSGLPGVGEDAHDTCPDEELPYEDEADKAEPAPANWRATCLGQ